MQATGIAGFTRPCYVLHSSPSQSNATSRQSTIASYTSRPVEEMPVASRVKLSQGSLSVKGRKTQENEDRMAVSQDSIGTALHSMIQGQVPTYSSVFDGHGGAHASAHAASKMHHLLAQSHLWGSISGPAGRDTPLDDLAESARQLFQSAFSRLDKEILRSGQFWRRTDGATALTAVHVGSLLFVANAGDSRAVLCRGRKAVRLTRDHKPHVEAERKRIVSRGGVVMQCDDGTWRVIRTEEGVKGKFSWTGLSTSRGLGDPEFKEHELVICEPDVTSVALQPDTDAFSIQASDGLWAHVSDQRAVDVVMGVLDEAEGKGGRGADMRAAAKVAARKLVELALAQGSSDDITVIVNAYHWE